MSDAPRFDRRGRYLPPRADQHEHANPVPHPLNDDWRYDPDDERGIVTDSRGRQVGVDFAGRVHDEHGRELDMTGQPIAEADGTPLPPTPSAPPNTGVSHRRNPGALVRHAGLSRHALAKRFPQISDHRTVPRKRN